MKFVRKSGYIASVKKNKEVSDEESKSSDIEAPPPPPRLPRGEDPDSHKFADLEVELSVDIGTTKAICEDLGKELARKGLMESRSHQAAMRPIISAAYAMMKGNVMQTLDTSQNNKSALFSARPNSSYSNRGRPSSASLQGKILE